MIDKERPLEWIAGSYKELVALPRDVRRRFGYALSLAQMGDQSDAAKPINGFGGAGVLEVVEDDVGGTYRAVYTVKFAEAVLLPEKEQDRHRHTEVGHGHHPRSAESGRDIGSGATKCKNESLMASRYDAVRATSMPISACPMPRS